MEKPIATTGEQCSPSHRTNRPRRKNANRSFEFQRSFSVVNTQRKAAELIWGTTRPPPTLAHVEAGGVDRREACSRTTPE